MILHCRVTVRTGIHVPGRYFICYTCMNSSSEGKPHYLCKGHQLINFSGVSLQKAPFVSIFVNMLINLLLCTIFTN